MKEYVVNFLDKFDECGYTIIKRTNVPLIFNILEEFMTEFKNDKYFVRKTIVYRDEPACVEKGLLDTFVPVTVQSVNYKNWQAILDFKTCFECRSKHGKIYNICYI